MTSPASAFVFADLEIHVTDPAPGVRERAIDALRTFRLIGVVEGDEESTAGTISASLAYTPGRGVAVDAGDTVESTPAQPIVDALAARLGAAVMLQHEDDMFYAAPPTAEADGAEVTTTTDTAEDADVHVFVVGGRLELGPDRRSELALQLESSLTVAPLPASARGERTLVVPHRALDMPAWPGAQRPVISLRRGAAQLTVQVYGSAATRTGRLRDRLAAVVIADWMGIWDPEPTPLIDPARGDAAGVVQRAVTEARRAVLADLTPSDADLVTETGVDATALADLLTRPLDDDVVRDVVRAFRLPDEVADLLEGRRRAADLPGASDVENTGIGGTMADGLLGEPDGTSLWARWRRVPHRHPRLAVLLIVLELALAAGIGVWAGVSPSPWNVILWIVAGALAIDAVGDAVLLALIRRRRRRSSDA